MEELRRRYAEPHRTFHDWTRVADMLAQAEAIVNGIADRTAFILAVLFHKAVFDRASPDAPQRSAALLRERLGRAVPAERLARAEALILALGRQDLPETRDPSLRGDAALLLDIDHAVLGEPEPAFDAYEAAQRREYAHLKEDAYRAGRATALRMLLWRERIYRTDRYFLERERRARRNIERLVSRLEA
jgi:predicted metal-dependent HD superfamily phosphohydrolase